MHILRKNKLLTTITGLLLATSIHAAEYPSRDIKLIVPWPAGGGADAISRKISNLAESKMGRSIYIENVGGAITATGLMQMTKARPDGYTLGVLTYDSIITLPRGNLVPGYSLDNIKPIARITKEADAIVASSQSGYTSLEDLITAAKAKPGSIRIGVAPEGSGPYLAVKRLEKLTGASFNVITYPGSSTAETEALLSGEIDLAISSLGDFSGILKSKDAVGLVELSSEQNPFYISVPPISEFGYSLETGSYIVLAAPKNTPNDVLEKITAAYHDAFQSDEFQKWVTLIGVTPSWADAAETTAWIDSHQRETFKAMDELGL